jgi:hypothetical protein
MHGRDLVPHEDVAHAPGVIVDEPLVSRVVAKLLDRASRFVGRDALEAVGMRGVDEQDRAASHRVLLDGGVPTLGTHCLARPNVALAVQLDTVGAVGSVPRALPSGLNDNATLMAHLGPSGRPTNMKGYCVADSICGTGLCRTRAPGRL